MNNDPSGDYYLTNDIDCSDTVNWNNGQGFEPIGSSIRFTGNFNGKGYEITDLYINRNNYYVGLFSFVQKATIKNVNLKNIIISGFNYSGGMAGYVENGSTLENCTASGSVVSSRDYVGGLVAFNSSSYIVRNHVDVDVKGERYVGGLVGYSSGGVIENSYATGDIDNRSIYAGGLVGYNGAVIENSYATGSVLNKQNQMYVGGLVGRSDNYITNCYSTGVVNGTNSYTGGLVGYSGGGSTTNSYWDIQTSFKSTSPYGGTGKTTVKMQLQSTFENWDFDEVWCMPANSYPKLKSNGVCLPVCSGCAVLKDGVCVAGDTCGDEHPNCIVADNYGICECTANSCGDGRKCLANGACADCTAADGCGSCGCGTAQKPTGTGSCMTSDTCCPGECNTVTGADSCSYSDDLCPDSACNRSTFACCASSLPYWRNSACKSCSTNTGLSGSCMTKGMTCNFAYNCVVCGKNSQCTCDEGQVADGLGGCVTPACSNDSECGSDKCVNAGKTDAFCADCSNYSQIWYKTACVSCPSGSVYSNGVCLCTDNKVWNSATNTCTEKSISNSSGDLIGLKRNSPLSGVSRYDRIKSRMTRIKTKIGGAAGDKSIE